MLCQTESLALGLLTNLFEPCLDETEQKLKFPTCFTTQESFAHSFSMGAAVERFFSTKEPYATVIEAASQLNDAHVSFLKIWGNLPPPSLAFK